MEERESRAAKKFGILDKCQELEQNSYKLVELRR